MSQRASLGYRHLLAFFSAAAYREDGLRARGANAVYLLLLLAVCVLPGVVEFNRTVAHFLTGEARLLIDQVPTVTITRGQAFVAGPLPYALIDPETGKTFAFLDTRPGADLSRTDATLLLTQDRVIYRKNRTETQSYSLAEIDSLVVDQVLIWKLARGIGGALRVLSYPVTLAWAFSVRLLQALIYALIALLFAALLRERRLAFPGAFRMAVLALTPVIVIQTVLGLAGLKPPFAGGIYFLLAMGYLGFGVTALGREPLAVPASPAVPTPVAAPAPIAVPRPERISSPQPAAKRPKARPRKKTPAPKSKSVSPKKKTRK